MFSDVRDLRDRAKVLELEVPLHFCRGLNCWHSCAVVLLEEAFFMDALSVGALRAAEQVAQAHGITVSQTEVVADGSNLLVHLGPAPLLARVATTTALL